MQNDKLNPPIQFSLLWLVLGGIIIFLIASWYGYVYMSTRKRQVQDISQLPLLPSYDITAIKQKYIALIDQWLQQYKAGQMPLRVYHEGLSVIVRDFVYEAARFPAPKLSLSELKWSPFKQLILVISDLYLREFPAVESGDPDISANNAKRMIVEWV